MLETENWMDLLRKGSLKESKFPFCDFRTSSRAQPGGWIEDWKWGNHTNLGGKLLKEP